MTRRSRRRWPPTWKRHPDEAAALAEAVGHLGRGRRFASRHTFPMHATVGALLVRGGGEILLVEHRAYQITLQPGGHLEPGDATLIDGAVRELTEETGVNAAVVLPVSQSPVYVEYGHVPARPEKGEPAHFHLDFGYLFTTSATTGAGPVQEAEVRGADWYPLAAAERLVGRRIRRAFGALPRGGPRTWSDAAGHPGAGGGPP